MEKEKLIEVLDNKLGKIEEIKSENTDSEKFKRWKDSTQTILRKAFGKDSAEFKDFQAISFYPMVFTSGPKDERYKKESFERGVKDAKSHLSSVIEGIKLFGVGNGDADKTGSSPESQSVTQNFYITQNQSQKIEQKISLDELDKETQQKVTELLNELEKEDKNKGKIKEAVTWLADKAIDVLIAIIVTSK